MRTPATVTAGLLASAALLLSACGGSDEAPAASSDGGTTASEESSTDSAGQAFCTEGEALFDGLEDDLDAAGPEDLAGVLTAAVEGLDSLTPPEEIAEAYGTVRDGYDELAQVAAGLDLTTQAGQTEFSAAADDLSAEVEPAENTVDDWVDANCESSSSTPSS